MKVSMHNWMRPEPIETTIARLGKSGYDGIEISGEPALYDADEVKRHMGQHGIECWGSVTLMTGGRDLVHEDHYVRLASVKYVKDCLSFVASAARSSRSSRRRSARSSRWPPPRRSGSGPCRA